MSDVKTLINDRIVSPGITNNAVSQTYGIVLKASEEENTCTVMYENNNAKMDIRKNVNVFSQDDNWFPVPGDRVILEESNDNNPIIVGKIRNYTEEERSKRQYSQDVHPPKQHIVRNKIS